VRGTQDEGFSDLYRNCLGNVRNSIAASADTITINFTGGTAAVSGSAITTTSSASWISYSDDRQRIADTDFGVPLRTLIVHDRGFRPHRPHERQFCSGGAINLNSTDTADLGLSAPEDGTFTGGFAGMGTGMQTTLCNGNPSA
jgi:hypothetical protein